MVSATAAFVCCLLLLLLCALPGTPKKPPDEGVLVGEMRRVPAAAEQRQLDGEVVPAASERCAATASPAPEPASAEDLTLVLTGASPHELCGIATVRRKDGTLQEAPFAEGCFVAVDSSTVDGVALRVPGFAIAWPRLGANQQRIAVPMQRAGSIQIQLTDSSGEPLGDRCVLGICQYSEVSGDSSWGNYQGNARAVTDANGVATLQGLLPGRYNLGTASLGEWDAARAEGIMVTAGCVTLRALRVPVLPPEQFGGFEFTAAEAEPFARGSLGDVTDFVFAVAPDANYMLHRFGKRVRCIVRGSQGQQVTGRLVALADGQLRPDLWRSTSVTITIGAVFHWQPTWER